MIENFKFSNYKYITDYGHRKANVSSHYNIHYTHSFLGLGQLSIDIPFYIKEMRNTFAISVTTPRVNAYGFNSSSFNLSFSIKVTIPDYSGRVLLATGVIPLGANPCTYLPPSFSLNITPPAVYSGFSSKIFVVMLLNSTVYTESMSNYFVKLVTK